MEYCSFAASELSAGEVYDFEILQLRLSFMPKDGRLAA